MIGGVHAAPRKYLCRGTAIFQDRESDRKVELSAIQCVHCQRIWFWRAGSGKLRGWCSRCNGFFCGPSCETCVPWEQLIENMEAGMPYILAHQHRPIFVAVSS